MHGFGQHPFARGGFRIVVIQTPVSRVPTVERVLRRSQRRRRRSKVYLSVLNRIERPCLINYAAYRVRKLRTFHPVKHHRAYGNLPHVRLAARFAVNQPCQKINVARSSAAAARTCGQSNTHRVGGLR